jgi:hypothetical protein
VPRIGPGKQLIMRHGMMVLLAIFGLGIVAGCAVPNVTEALVMSNGTIAIHVRDSSGRYTQNRFYGVHPGDKDYARLLERLRDTPPGK